MNIGQIAATGILALCPAILGSGCLRTECRATDYTCSPGGFVILALAAGPGCILLGGASSGCGTLSLSGIVTTPYGPAQGTTTSGDTDMTGNAARFSFPHGITTDGASLYVAGQLNHKIRKID